MADETNLPFELPVPTPAQSSPAQMIESSNIDLLLDVQLEISIELGRCRREIREVLALAPGAIVELDHLAGEPVDVLVNGRLLARGEVVGVGENFGVRILDIIKPQDRLGSLR